MSDYARNVTIDVDSGDVMVDGQPFPWFYSGAQPAIIEGENGEPLPGLTVTIACSDLTVISPNKALL